VTRSYPVKWTEAAFGDIDAIDDYLTVQDPIDAPKVVDGIRQKAASLTTSPMRGRVVPELLDLEIETYRELVHGPWRIIYTFANETVYIHAVFDGRRDVGRLLVERLLPKKP
jgi:toxin ParE1/3/4